MTIEERSEVKNIAESIFEKFGKGSLNAEEFSEYLGQSRATVCEKIRNGSYPGQHSNGSYTIPINSIALWEVKLAKTKIKESEY